MSHLGLPLVHENATPPRGSRLLRRAWLSLTAIFSSILFLFSGSLIPPASAAVVEQKSPIVESVQSFDYLILALSWSPTYCASRSMGKADKADAGIGEFGSRASRSDSPQCRDPANRGFVLHGLWPQALDRGRLRCPNGRAEFSKSLFERAIQIFPDLNLAQS